MSVRSLGKQILQGRAAMRMTQTALADALGVTRQSVAFWEAGNGDPSAANIAELQVVLGVSLDIARAATSDNKMRELHGRSLELETLQSYVLARQRALSESIRKARTPAKRKIVKKKKADTPVPDGDTIPAIAETIAATLTAAAMLKAAAQAATREADDQRSTGTG